MEPHSLQATFTSCKLNEDILTNKRMDREDEIRVAFGKLGGCAKI